MVELLMKGQGVHVAQQSTGLEAVVAGLGILVHHLHARLGGFLRVGGDGRAGWAP